MSSRIDNRRIHSNKGNIFIDKPEILDEIINGVTNQSTYSNKFPSSYFPSDKQNNLLSESSRLDVISFDIFDNYFQKLIIF